MTTRATLLTMLTVLLTVGMLACQPKTSPAPAKAKAVPAADEAAQAPKAADPAQPGALAAAPAAPEAAPAADDKGEKHGKECDHAKAAAAGDGEQKPEAGCGKQDHKECDHAKAAGDGEEKHVESGCGGGGGQLENPEPQVRKDPAGNEVAHYGDAFGVDAEIAVTELLANPSAYKDKMVRIKGDISAMCHHKRGWFAITAEDKSGRSVRVVTQPVFLVPHGAIGKTGVAEGKVELIEVAPEFAAHLKKGHNLGEQPEAGKPIIHVIVRARGAEFI